MDISQAAFRTPDRIIDTHCHYNLEPLAENWQQHWQKAQGHGVVESWIPGTNLESSHQAVEIAKQDNNLWALVGFHPTDIPDEKPEDSTEFAQLRELIAKNRDTVIGLGEVGLDYFRLRANDAVTREHQRVWLRALLALANEFHLFVTLHVRDQQTPEVPAANNAYWDTLEIVRAARMSEPCILHCVSGPRAYIAAMLEMGAYVSFAGNITYPNAQALRDIWNMVPAERRLLETDAPFLAPQEYRGQSCEPWMIAATAHFSQALLQ